MLKFDLDVTSDARYPDEGREVTIVVRCGNTVIRMTPEDSTGIIGQSADAGCFRGATSNGEFRIKWDAVAVQMTVGKYGDGCGGTLDVMLERTEDVESSFAHMLRDWQEACA
jgi:hypothetical protein